jgi:hypothetical protein
VETFPKDKFDFGEVRILGCDKGSWKGSHGWIGELVAWG